MRQADITVDVTLTHNKLAISMTYTTSILSPGNATHLSQTLTHVLSQLVSGADSTLSRLPLLSAPAEAQIRQWNARLPERLEGRLHDKFNANVASQPDAPAINSWDETMSYAELDRYSSKLAHHLIGLGVGPEIMVPFCFDKSAWTVVSVMATLKAGGANVAISPDYPKARIETILNDIKATVVLVGERCRHVMDGFDLKAVPVDKDFLDSLPEPDEALTDGGAKFNNPAFVVFTSGSTGVPKGIILEHAALYSSIDAHAKLLNIDSTSRVLQFASYTFDVSMFDMLTTLMHGGCVCIPSDQERLNDLEGAVNRLGVNTACLTTTVSTMLDPAEVPGLRHLILLGEAVTKRLVDIWGPATTAGVRLTNTYGPAEASILCSATPIVPGAANPSNFGTAVGSRLWIVDQNNHHRLMPVGSVGELLIEGPILARSYLNLPQKTAEAFIQIPSWFSDDDPSSLRRLYKTGDLVRYNSNGTMDFVARRDGQVKVNGQRVELGEIEHHISTGEGVAGVVVALAKAGPCKGRLVTLVHLKKDITGQDVESTSTIKLLADRDKPDVSETVDAIRQSLSSQLPHYMVPTIWIIVEAIPLTATGKTYRAMIAKWIDGMDQETYEKVSGIVAGETAEDDEDLTDTERTIRAIWAKVLNVTPQRVGASVSLLSLGGDSIAAMAAVAEFKAAGYPISVGELMKGKTVKELSLVCEEPHGNGESTEGPTAVHLSTFSDDMLQTFNNTVVPSLESSFGLKNGLDDIEDVFPCSPMQSGILVAQTKSTGSYELHYMMEITPKKAGEMVDLDRLCSAWQTLVDRHSALRTVFIESITQQGLFDQVILKNAGAHIEKIQPSNRRVGYLAQLLSDADHLDYQALQIPHRLLVATTSEGSVIARLEASHSIIDGASASILMRELALAYDGSLPPTPAPLYSDFIDHLYRQPGAAHLDFWKTYLAGVEPCNIPHLNDGVRLSEKKLRAAPVSVNITKETFKQLCRENGVTLFQVFQAAWALVLRGYANTDDVCFGYVTSGRDAPVEGIQQSIGAFISMLICRMSIDDKTPLKNILKDMQQDFITGLEHQHCSLAEIYHALKLSGQTLFNTAIAFQKVSSEEDAALESNSVVLKDLGEHDPTDYDIMVIVDPDSAYPKVHLNYWSTSFSEKQAHNIASTLSHVLATLVQDPQRSVGDLALVGDDHRSQIMSWNTKVPESEEVCLHTLFQRQARAQPQAPAVEAHDGSLSYAELDVLSDKLAHHLVSLGVKPETLVPFCFSKSMWTTVSIMGILKAGGGCVALDPAHPIDRLSRIIADSEAHVIVSGAEHADMFAHLEESKTIVPIAAELFDNLPVSESEPCPTVTPNNTAFIIFTSGSTGTPKGIVLEHVAVSTSCLAHGKVLHVGPDSRVLQFAAHTFDISIQDTCTTLMFGGCICVPSDYDRMNDLAGFINRSQANWACLTPTVANLIDPDDVPCLKVLVTAGEALTKRVTDAWAKKVDINNCYGPAECTIHTMWSGRVMDSETPSNIGYGMVNRVWLASQKNYNQLVPIGCVGEIVIEGPTVARGYLNLPGKTAEVFVEDPVWLEQGYSKQPGKEHRRLYRSGDLGRYNSDGSIDFQGRADHQVKLRGQRIELGEIEYHISNHDQVEHGLVLKSSSGPCRERLVGIVSLYPDDNTPPNNNGTGEEIKLVSAEQRPRAAAVVSELRQKLSAALPLYMVPATWAVFSVMPLTSSGKTYRKIIASWVESMDNDTFREISQLVPVPGEANGDSNGSASDAAPFTGIEASIQSVWSQVLNLPVSQVGPGMSFLSLGGDSISAMQVMSHLRAGKISVSVQDVLRSKTIPQLAKCAKSMDGYVQSSVKPEMTERLEVPFGLSPIQKYFFASSPGEAANHFNQSFFLRLTEETDPELLHRSLDALVKRHSMLRARISKDESGEYRQKIVPFTNGSYGFQVHAGVESMEEVTSIASQAQSSLDIERGPVFSVHLSVVNGAEQYLFMVAHHLVIDLVSWRTMLQEIEDSLTSKPSNAYSSAPFQAWSRIYEEAPASGQESTLPYTLEPGNMDFWGMSNRPNLQRDTAEVAFALDKETTAAVLGSSHKALRTEPVDLHLAAVINSFAHCFPDRATPTIFDEGHGREMEGTDLDISGTVGWFTMLKPLHVPVSAEQDMIHTLKLTKDRRRQLTSWNGHRYLASRVSDKDGEVVTSSGSAIEILFNYEGQYQQLEREGARLKMLPLPASDVGPDVRRFSLFEISSVVKDGQLHFTFAFNKSANHQERIQAWIQRCSETIQLMVERLVQIPGIQYTLSDFPLVDFDYKNISDFSNNIVPAQLSALTETNSPPLVEDVYPCAPMQQGILLSQAKEPWSYAVQYAWEILDTKGKPILADMKRLRNAWESVAQRHVAMRTVFLENLTGNGVYAQVVLEKMKVDFQVIDAGTTDPRAVLSELPKMLYQLGGPQHRFTVCTTADGRTCAQLDVSHSIIDGGSVTNIIIDLSRAYTGTLDKLPPAASFRPFIEFVQQRDLESDLAYWKNYLADAEPCNFPRLAEQNAPKQLHTLAIDLQQLSGQTNDFCASNGVTMFNLFQTAWAIVLRAYTRSDNILFGHLASGRDAPIDGIQDAVGTFIKMIVCASKLGNQVTARQAIEAMATNLSNSLSHQDCTLTEIQNALGFTGESMFTTGIDLQRVENNGIASEDALIRFHEILSADPTEAHVLIHFEVGEGILRAVMTYWTSIISDDQAQDVSDVLVTALTEMMANPDQPVSELNLLKDSQHQKLVEYNYPAPKAIDLRIHDVFQRRVMETPEALAVCSTETELTYQQLDELSTRLAHYLVKEHQVGPEVKVPLCFERSVWVEVAMLAVFKAGGCMVPLDHSHPVERLTMIAEEVEATVILTSRNKVQMWTDNAPNCKIVPVDAAEMPRFTDKSPIKTAAKSSNAAYMIFTSGTTGRPKGTILEHSAFVSNAAPIARGLCVSEKTRALQFMSYSFDGSLAELLAPLLVGGCVCIPTDDEKSNHLSDFIARFEINWACLTPSFARLFTPSELPTLKTLCLAGEAMTKEDITTWSGAVTLVNGFGPTECSVCTASNRDVGVYSTPGDIGTPVGCTVWIVDPDNHDRLLPPGCPGEMLVGGPTLAREYWKNPDKTDEVFIKNPAWYEDASSRAHSRFYKTGDLVQLGPEGRLRFLGRKDNQVKLRGQRLELGEVEYNIKANLPSAQRVVAQVVSRTGAASDKQLVAFIHISDGVAENGGSSQAVNLTDALSKELVDLQIALAQALPSYMVPFMYIPVSSIPLTVAGKINERALKKLVVDLAEEKVAEYALASADKRAPTNTMESAMLRFWEAILPVTNGSLGIDDNFFQRGGDSLAAIKLVAAARRDGVAITVAQIFGNPTIASLSLVASRFEGEEELFEVVPFSLISTDSKEALVRLCVTDYDLGPRDVLDIYPATPLQEGLMALSLRTAGSYVLQNTFDLSNGVDIERYVDAWKFVTRKFSILRTRIINAASGTHQIIVEDDIPLTATTEALGDYLKRDLATVMGYGHPLSRLALVKKASSTYFVWTIHHVIYDGFSIGLIMAALAKAYLGQDVPEPPSFNTYVRHISGTNRDDAEEYWTSRFSGAAPSNFPRLPSSTHQVCADQTITHNLQLDRPVTSNITNATVVRAAWALLMSQYTHSTDVVFGATVTGRDASLPGITDIVGPTLATVPVRVTLDLEQTVSGYLSDIQTQTIEAIPFQHVGIQNIRRMSPDCQAACDFRNLLVIQPEGGKQDSIDGVKLMDFGRDDFHTYPLGMECFLGAHSIKVAAQYDEGVIGASQVRRLLFQFEHVIRQLSSATADTEIGYLDLIAPEDKLSLSKRKNAAVPEKVDACAHDVIKRWVVSQPDAPAISSWDGEFTFADVDQLSTKLAVHLISLGIKANSMIPLCFEKSAWTVIAMLAVSKAGSAFVLLDPTNPTARLKTIVEQVQATLILASDDCASLWESDFQVVHVNQSTLDALPIGDESVLQSRARPSDALYVIFTSGSTGTPKGCVLEHSAFLTSAAHYTKTICMDNTSRVLQFASYSFDVSILETLSAMSVGACACIPSAAIRAEGVASMIRNTRATWAFLTPTVVKMIRPADVPTLKTLVLGGEALSKENIEAWSQSLQFMNGYGPSECAIASVIQPNVTLETDAANIGHAVGGSLWVVDPDDHDRLVPIGCPGELLIEGHLLARGYLNREDLTAAAFITNPRWARSGDGPRRFYKTGDVVRYNEDLSINFIGRKDSQVKLRGQRIELGEIEQRLVIQPSVKHAAALLPKTGIFHQKIVGVVALKELASSSDPPLRIINTEDKKLATTRIAEIQEALSQALPLYMVPTVWALVTAMPLSPSGKLDRVKVRQWLETADEETRQHIESIIALGAVQMPQTVIEQELQDICCSVLNLPPSKIGMNKSFVSLGGDSITAMHLISRCRSAGLYLALENLLSGKTLAQVAASSQRQARQSYTITEEADVTFNLTPIQQMHFELTKSAEKSGVSLTDGSSRFHQSFFLRVHRQVQASDVASAVERLVRRHTMLRARFNRNDTGEWTQIIPSEVDGSYHFFVHTARGQDELESVISEAQNGLDIEKGPVFGATLFEKSDFNDEQLLFLVAHHLVIDLVSWRVIMHDLETVLTTGSMPIDKPLPFQAWARLQAQHAQEELAPAKALSTQIAPANIAYWGMEDTPNTYGDTREESFVLDKELTASLLGVSHEALRTDVVDVLIASVLTSFNQVFQDRQVPTVFVEGHGREPWAPELDIANTVGWFTTISPVHVPVNAGQGVVQAVKQTKDVRRRIPGNGWPYFTSRYLNGDGKVEFGNYGTAEIGFNYLGLYQQLEQADGLFSQYDWEAPASAVDVGPKTARWSLIEVSAVVNRGSLHMSFNYNTRMKDLAKIGQWVKASQAALENAITSLSNLTPAATLSDFPRLSLTYDGLSQLVENTLPTIGVSSWQDVESVYPCSPLQTSMLVTQSQGSDNYQTYTISELKHPEGVQLEKLRSAWQRVVDRHSILRTIFVDGVATNGDGSVFNQVLLREMVSAVALIDAADDEEAVTLLRQQHSSTPMINGSMPAHQLTLCQTSTRTFMRFDISHALVDGGSIASIFTDLADAYDDKLSADPAFAFVDYIQYLDNKPPEEGLAYWKTYLTEVEPCLFPTAKEGSVDHGELQSVNVQLSTSAEELSAFCDQNGVTISNLVQTAWGLVLRSYVGSEQVCFAYAVSGRDIPLDGIQDAVGPFINMLLCRLDLTATASLSQVTDTMQQDFLEALPHQHISLAEILHGIQMSGRGLFNTAVSIQRNSPAPSEDDLDLSIQVLHDFDPSEVSRARPLCDIAVRQANFFSVCHHGECGVL